jgi:hypothetical protein
MDYGFTWKPSNYYVDKKIKTVAEFKSLMKQLF